MAVRKQCNRYRTEPFGKDYKAVLKKAKAFFSRGGYHESFEMTDFLGDGYWLAHPRTLPPFKIHKGTIIVEWNRDKKRWEERDA